MIKRAAALAMRHKGPGDADSPLVVLGSALGPDLDTYSQKQGGAGVHSPVPVSPSPQTLRRAVRHASLSAKPPVLQNNGRFVLPGM